VKTRDLAVSAAMLVVAPYLPALADSGAATALGQTVVFIDDAIQCQSTDALIGARRFIVAKDFRAMVNYAFDSSHGCTFVFQGNRGVIEAVSMWPDTFCVRLEGTTNCEWTFATFFDVVHALGEPKIVK
jgi:hypothetical protein